MGLVMESVCRWGAGKGGVGFFLGDWQLNDLCWWDTNKGVLDFF
jgi:hypothetical protein